MIRVSVPLFRQHKISYQNEKKSAVEQDQSRDAQIEIIACQILLATQTKALYSAQGQQEIIVDTEFFINHPSELVRISVWQNHYDDFLVTQCKSQ